MTGEDISQILVTYQVINKYWVLPPFAQMQSFMSVVHLTERDQKANTKFYFFH